MWQKRKQIYTSGDSLKSWTCTTQCWNIYVPVVACFSVSATDSDSTLLNPVFRFWSFETSWKCSVTDFSAFSFSKTDFYVFMMEVSMEMNIAARGWQVYGKTVLQSPHKRKTASHKRRKGNVRNGSISCCMDVEKEK